MQSPYPPRVLRGDSVAIVAPVGTNMFEEQPVRAGPSRLLAPPNRPLHGFRRHLGCGAVAAKITVNVWDIVQLSTPITPQLYIGF